jgi:hypothetical protein
VVRDLFHIVLPVVNDPVVGMVQFGLGLAIGKGVLIGMSRAVKHLYGFKKKVKGAEAPV